MLPIVHARCILEDLEGTDSTLRLIVLEHDPWRLTHWTPFNALAPTDASSPGYRHALERQHTTPDLPYGLEIRHEQTKALSLLWADDGVFEVTAFVRGAWEDAALAL
jgi:hypothetical protein